jgi:hypothetical protein
MEIFTLHNYFLDKNDILSCLKSFRKPDGFFYKMVGDQFVTPEPDQEYPPYGIEGPVYWLLGACDCKGITDGIMDFVEHSLEMKKALSPENEKELVKKRTEWMTNYKMEGKL